MPTAGAKYFFERGKIRAIDQNGLVYTLMGAGFNAGDGAPATSARLGAVNDAKVWRNGTTDTVVVADGSEFRFREFAIGGVITLVAGQGVDGVADKTRPAASQTLSYASSGQIEPFYIQVHPTLGTIFSGLRHPDFLSGINRSTGVWSDLVGAGGTGYYLPAAQGLSGGAIDYSGYSAQPLGFAASSVHSCTNIATPARVPTACCCCTTSRQAPNEVLGQTGGCPVAHAA